MELIEKIKKLTSQLFPSGRAFKMPLGGEFEKMRDGLALSEKRAYEDAKSILDSAIPDNDNFSEDDATAWEVRLGLITNTSLALESRKLAIRRKMNHPGDIRPRQHYLFLERELQAAGFDVYVHENLSRINPLSVSVGGSVQHGDIQHGDSMHGGVTSDRVANSLDPDKDSTFDIGPGYSNTFFIGGEVFGSYGSIEGTRKIEFRQLILKVKPQNQIGFLLINYV